MNDFLTIIGAGLAGSEAAWQAAERGIPVTLYEMRSITRTAAHKTDSCAELVCSNSLGNNLPHSAPYILKEELRNLNSLVISAGDNHSVPAGSAHMRAGRLSRQVENHRLRPHAHALLCSGMATFLMYSSKPVLKQCSALNELCMVTKTSMTKMPSRLACKRRGLSVSMPKLPFKGQQK